MHHTTTTNNPLLILLVTIIVVVTSCFRGGALQQQLQQPHHRAACWPSERAALLAFKKGITSDPGHLLSSWRGWDCCRWRGVTCSNNLTGGHVLKVRLANPDPGQPNALEGEISASLLSLEHLEHLDLSMNYWGGGTCPMPPFLGSMKNLRYLNLSGIQFSGGVPSQFGNLSRLQYLDLSNTVRDSTDIALFTTLPMLRHLSLSGINLSRIADWPQKINMIPTLRVIDLSGCALDRADQSLPYFNLTKLEGLDLSGNGFNHTVASCWFWKATSLKYIQLGETSLFGQFDDALENMTSLQVLGLSSSPSVQVVDLNPYTLQMVGNFKNLCSLRILDLSYSHKTSDITMFMESLPRCAWGELQELHLGANNFTGNLPNLIGHFTRLRILELNDYNLGGGIPPSIGNCTRLSTLHIFNNHLEGSVPTEIGVLTNLTSLDLSNNRLSGVITQDHFRGLKSLRVLVLSYNINLKIIVQEGWLPPFRLEQGDFALCQIGPLFPAWLQQQVSINYLDISSTGVKDKIPEWFWYTVSQATYLYMSDNELIGSLPSHLGDMPIIHLNLSSNHLTGPIRQFPRNIVMLDISFNSFSGILPLSFDAPALTVLLLFSNKIGGSIPESMCNLSSLVYQPVLSHGLKS